MRMIFLALPLALGLAACQTYPNGDYGNGPYGYPPAPAPYPQPYPQPYPTPNPYPQPYPSPYPGGGQMAPYHAVGTEPGWSLDIDSREMRFSGSYGENPITQPTPPVTIGVAGEIYDTPRLNVNIVHAQCSDGMSDRSYPDRVEVRADGRLYRGCGGASGYGVGTAGTPGYDGPPPGTGIGTLAETNWRVTSIDGIRVPNNNFYMNFLPDRVAAKFGCNAIGASYSTKGNTLDLGAALATRMACADMTFENKATRIIALPLRVDLTNPEVMILTNASGTIELARLH